MNPKARALYAAVLLCAIDYAAVPMQAQDGIFGPPKVLVIQSEMLKPGKDGSAHDKTEGAFVAAAKAGHAPFHYYAVTSMSGAPQALFLTGYASFAAWEEENGRIGGVLGASLDKATLADGELVSAADVGVWTLEPEMSLNVHGMTGTRYLGIVQFSIKPGHTRDWDDAVKLMKDGYTKANPQASWAMYSEAYGVPGARYIAILSLKSMAEIDVMVATDKKLAEAMGSAGARVFDEISATTIESRQTNLFRIRPNLSLPPWEWVAAEPDFWEPQPTTKKPAPKPTK